MGGSNMKKFRNILALLMVVVMLVAVMPMNVFAEPSNKHAIKIAAGIENGAVTADPTSATKGTKVTLTVEPANGYELDTLTATPNVELTDADGKKIFTMPDEDVTVTATFKKTLDTLKTEAKTEVGNLPNLSDDEKTAAKDTIEKATDKAGVDKAVADAKALDKSNKEKADEKAALADAKKTAKDAVDKLANLSQEDKDKFKKAIDEAADKAGVDKVLEAAKAKANPGTTTPATKYNITVKTIGSGYASTDVTKSEAGKTITVTAKPYSGYAVARVYYKDAFGNTKNINTYFNDYYYNGYYGDYYRYLSDYENYYYYDYSSYDAYLKARHYSFWNNGYRYLDDYGYRYYDRYDNYFYKYLDDYRRYYSDRYDTYEDYLRAEHYSHYYNYRYLDRYDYGYYKYGRYGYNTSDTFTMPASDVTVYVEFTDWTYYGYYYDDYYYYRSRRDKEAEEAKAKKEAAKKEEEAKAKAEAEKLPQVYENKAVIAIGSNVLDKVSKNVHTVHAMDTPAYVKNGRVMLPLRYVAEALGLQVSWVPETKTVIIWDLTQRVEIPVKSNRIIVNGITYTSDVKPEIKSERTMLPIANIARALGLIDGSDIVWDQYNKQVTLTRKVLSK